MTTYVLHQPKSEYRIAAEEYTTDKDTLSQHQHDRKEAARRWQCNLCDRRFDKRADIHRHQVSVHRDRMHSPPELYHCPHEDCNRRDRGFPRIDNFKEHLKRVHNDYEYTKIHYGR